MARSDCLADYRDIGVVNLHHNIDVGKMGLLLEPDTTSYFESTFLEVDSFRWQGSEDV